MIKGPFLLGIAISCVCLYGQKPAVDTGLMGVSWPSVVGGMLSADGRYAAYTIQGVPVGSSTLVIRALKGKWQKEVVGATNAQIMSDSRWVMFQVHDSLCQLSLGGIEQTIIKDLVSYQLVGMGRDQRLVYRLRGSRTELIVRELSTGKEAHYRNIKKYRVNKQGTYLLLERGDQADSGRGSRLSLLELSTGQERGVWEGEESHGHIFDQEGTGVAFLTAQKEGGVDRVELWYYHCGMEHAVRLVYDRSPGIDTGLTILGETRLIFTRGGDRLYFYLTGQREVLPPATGVQVDIWHYKDWPLQSEQLNDPDPLPLYLAAVPVKGGRVVRLQRDGERIFFQGNGVPGDMAVVSVLTDSLVGQLEARSFSLYVVSAIDGSRRLLEEYLPCQPFEHEFRFSPAGRWILWFNRCRKTWYSYDGERGINRSVSGGIPYPIYNENSYEFAERFPYDILAVGVGGWMEEGRKVLLYDDYDLWQVDLSGMAVPVCVTKGYGRQHGVKLRIAWDNDHRGEDEGVRMLKNGDSVILSGFNSRSMENGFFVLRLSGLRPPALLCMVPALLYAEGSQLDHGPSFASLHLQKATGANVWLLRRQSELDAPNCYTMEDFRNFHPLSDIQPQRAYNWLTAELLHWKTLSGKEGKGILYKPENFDPAKKYPVLFNYYEQQATGLHHYPTPDLCRDNIDIAYFVSRGYLVCIPDIHYRIGCPGEGVVDVVVSAAQYLSRRSYVDSLHMGVQGHSFGGFETNYLVTHTNIFAAAVESAGPTDLIEFYSRLNFGLDGSGRSLHYYFEMAQGRMGATLWERPDLYQENSAILGASKVTTPLLIVHNKGDASVPFMQGVELFTALQRLGKPVWMLQYDRTGHVILLDSNSRDYTLRLLQFFDHYLKGSSAPIWMTDGMPAVDKERKNGY